MSLLIYPPILPFLLPFAITHADPVNITVDDTSDSLVYSPASSWHASTVPCSTCLAPSSSVAFQGTWHDGTHIIPTVDADDVPNTSEVGSGDHGKGQDDDDGGSGSDDEEDDDDKGSSTASPTANPFFIPNFDSDDPGFKDQLVSAQFNFTGSAVYVYALIPLGAAKANSTPTYMNLTFLMDSHPAGTFQHTGTASAAGFLPSQLVFRQTGLAEAPHSLTMQVGPDSVLLLDYIVYTQGSLPDAGDGSNSTFGTSTSSAPGSQTSSGTGSSAPSLGPGTTNLSASQSKAHNIATFAGAVGGSVGLLAVLALSLAISIYRRRLRAARRDRRYRRSQNRSDPEFDGESFHTDGSEDSPPMQGPAPFVPRYFPGTVVPAPPPPYSPPDATTALLSSTSPVPWAPPLIPAPGEDTTYADRPPPSPPPIPEDGLDDYFSPPSFPAAISSPIPAILAGYSPVPTTSAPLSTSPVPLHTNGSGSRGVYATDPHPPRSRANSDAQSQRSDYSDRPPSFASQAPPYIPFSQHDGDGRVDGEGELSRQRTSDEDRASARSVRSR